MNKKNNSRYKMSSEKIETAFLSLLPENNYEKINISQVCSRAGINRSTFYCHYDDINDLVIKIENKFASSLASIFNYGERQTNEAFLEMFEFIKKNKSFYKVFLSIPYQTISETNTKQSILSNIKETKNAPTSNEIELRYRAGFFGAGIKEICRIWLERDCLESPKDMAGILLKEYSNRR